MFLLVNVLFTISTLKNFINLWPFGFLQQGQPGGLNFGSWVFGCFFLG